MPSWFVPLFVLGRFYFHTGVNSNGKAEEWIYVSGIVGRDCDHRDFGWLAFAGGASGAGGSSTDAVHEQHEAGCISATQLS